MADFELNTPGSLDTGPRKKRSRVQFSCTACRARKLKCCRTQPCINCRKRGEDNLCTYVGPGPRRRGVNSRPNPSHVQDRLQHLENLVKTLAQKKSVEDGQPQADVGGIQHTPPRSTESDNHGFLETPSDSSLEHGEETSLDQRGKLIVNDSGTSYIDGAHWRAILVEIEEVKKFLEEDGPEESGLEEPLPSTSPILLLGINEVPSKDELLADIPPRNVTDRLVSIFFNSQEPLIIAFHIPTFQKEYNNFWLNPKDVSPAWLSILYSMLTLAIFFQQRNGEPLPSYLTQYSSTTFHKRSSYGLVLSKYTTPGRYKVEALSLCMMCDFYKSNDAQLGVSFMLGITIRLAIATGYHRDQRHYSNISVFEGEMRRRQWAILCQLDALVSFQVGLPKTIQSWQYDTELPHNLLDGDFDENVDHLPTARPETEWTPASYTRSKARIMSVFGRISDLAYSREPVTYDETLEIDRKLEEAHDILPSFFRMRSMAQSIADNSELIIRRYTLELLYQKARCVLHRRYLADARLNPRYTYSRTTCITAAKELLRHHADLYHESQPGGQLYRDRQLMNSLQNADCLLGAMIICLELSYDYPLQGQKSSEYDMTRPVDGHEDLRAMLETSHRIFEESRQHSADSRKGYAALTIMLRRVKNHHQHHGGRSNEPVTFTAQPQPQSQVPEYNNPQMLEFPDLLNGSSNEAATGQFYAMEPAWGSLDMIDDMLNAPADFDWRLWDRQMR